MVPQQNREKYKHAHIWFNSMRNSTSSTQRNLFGILLIQMDLAQKRDTGSMQICLGFHAKLHKTETFLFSFYSVFEKIILSVFAVYIGIILLLVLS